MNVASRSEGRIARLHRIGWTRLLAACRIPAGTLRSCRVLIPALYLAFLIPDSTWLASVPSAWFDPAPLSLAAVFGGFPGLLSLRLLQTLLMASLACVMLGFRARHAGYAFVALHIVLTSFEYGFGKIDHVAHVLTFAILCCSLEDWGEDTPRRARRFPIPGDALFAILVAFGMFTAGFEKALNWIDFDLSTSGLLGWHVGNYYDIDRNELLAPYVTRIPRIGLELLDVAAVAFELAPLALLFVGRRAWMAWAVVACSFHMGTALMLNITFPYQTLAYLPFLLPATALQERVDARVLRALGGAVLAAAAYRVLATWTGWAWPQDVVFTDKVKRLWFDTAVWFGLMVYGASRLASEIRKRPPIHDFQAARRALEVQEQEPIRARPRGRRAA